MSSILVVDDDASARNVTQRSLSSFGFDLDFASSTQEARSAAREKKFDLILIDFDLGPGQSADTTRESGITLIHELRAAKVYTPMIMYTSMTGSFYEMSAFDAGADDYISKAMPILNLVSKLHRHIMRGHRSVGDEQAISQAANKASWEISRTGCD